MYIWSFDFRFIIKVVGGLSNNLSVENILIIINMYQSNSSVRILLNYKLDDDWDFLYYLFQLLFLNYLISQREPKSVLYVFHSKPLLLIHESAPLPSLTKAVITIITKQMSVISEDDWPGHRGPQGQGRRWMIPEPVSW